MKNHLNLNDYETAHSLLQIHPLVTERDSDYYKFYTILLERELNNIPEDSIQQGDLNTCLEIIDRKNDVSDLVMAFLNFKFDSSYVIIPEQWQEESSRPMIEPKSNNQTRKHNQKTDLYTSVFPNPGDKELSVSFKSDEYDYLTLSLSNVLGETIKKDFGLIRETPTIIELKDISEGVYYLHFYSGQNRISTEKIIVIH